ncbi:MAG: RagB/SusD family nutrient uptake outer membrane protein [Balneolaceae bacterium]|nr:MAG: RagB/SusD family nutrient uptake outer membrane protein [Balneolaceae bacterium]
MKKFNLTKFAVITFLLVSFTGCNDILDSVEPATSVSLEVALSSPEGVRALRTSMYSKMRESGQYTTQYFVAPSAFTDETRVRPGATRYQALNAATGTEGTVHLGNWGGSYNIIQDANLLIGGIEAGVMNQAELDRFRGEAYALRAFAMHNLVRVYGYDPGNFGQGPEPSWTEGVVIRTEPVFDLADADLRPRSSVNDVYAQIFSDLEEAARLLAGVNANNTFATEAFVHGIAARAHLYAGNWGEAAAAAQRAIDNFPGSLETTADGVANMFNEVVGGHPEALFKIIVNPDTEGTTAGGSFINEGPAAFTSDQWISQLPTQFLLDKYGDDDHRLGWYMDCAAAQRTGPAPSNCDAINDNGFSIIKFNGVRGNTVDDMPYMRLAEMYLIQAEAAAKAANDPNAGVAALQTLRDARNAGPVPAEALANMTAFEDEILDERMRELAVEGHRFFDLKRLGRDVRNPDGSIKMRADSYRILAPIPISLRNVNPLLVNNPGY